VIARYNVILLNLGKVSGTIPEATLNKFAGNAHYVRAAKYADLVFLFGDVVYSREILDLKEAFTLSKTPKNTIKEGVYEDFDQAAALLPLSYGSSDNKLATKSAAYAMKPRLALQMGD